jgi:DNA-binding transcriptional regulator YhcF (GntR family)
MDFEEIVSRLNAKTATTKSIAEELGVNQSTVQRRLNRAGYFFDKEKEEWIVDQTAPQNPEKQTPKKQENNIISKPTSQETNKTENNPSKKKEIQQTSKTIKKVTYEIDEDLHFELRIEAFKRKKNVSDLVEQAIREYLSK